MRAVQINRRQYLELEKLAFGAFDPLKGFMTAKEFHSVVETMHLPDGALFPLPVFFDLPKGTIPTVKPGDELDLHHEGVEVGKLRADDVYTCDKKTVSRKVFGTDDPAHPGVAHFFRMGDTFIGGPIQLTRRTPMPFGDYERTPEETRRHFKANGWRHIVGFQTRNVPHRAHEYLIRLALEYGDGVFLQVLVGAKKVGDYTPEAVLAGYEALIDRFLPSRRILLGVLSTSMRYAGPREALFHALIRRNYGCTHFVVGRDHAGVGGYYGKYEAQEMARRFEDELGIKILALAGPFYCKLCGGVATERSCPHYQTNPAAIQEISGTEIRSALLGGNGCPPEIIRAEVLQAIRGVEAIIRDEAA